MHLKTILIFCSFCFFTGIISDGLNARQIDLFEKLILDSKFGNNIDTIKNALYCHDIEETYNDYNVDDENSVKIFKILNFLAKVKKRGDDRKVEKLDINEVQIISNKFSNLDTNNDGLLDKEQCITLIDYYVSNVVTRNKNDNENLKSAVVNLKKEIYDEYTQYRLNVVLIKVLFYKAQLNNTEFGERYNFFARDSSKNSSVNIVNIEPPLKSTNRLKSCSSICSMKSSKKSKIGSKCCKNDEIMDNDSFEEANSLFRLTSNLDSSSKNMKNYTDNQFKMKKQDSDVKCGVRGNIVDKLSENKIMHIGDSLLCSLQDSEEVESKLDLDDDDFAEDEEYEITVLNGNNKPELRKIKF
ncbi:uncharacterized protein LOC126905980 [Daktulosphaira vitifoliae]|uniref:uncharacterized protein LOC126905980 n=1 Tax=Daktulosphaira vitifoliae TaxID=58002 RepID=UPI0021AA95F9|nr:uncharacterized protein LOC126905980 [Daktulosphaira vitifoliae]